MPFGMAGRRGDEIPDGHPGHSVAHMSEPKDLGDARGEWYYCFKHEKVERRDECNQMDRMGPYPTAEDARNWRERVAERNANWGDDD